MSASKTLTLFFTHDVSLKLWKEKGLFDREVKPYLYLAKHRGWKIHFYTHGDADDLDFRNELSPIEITPAYLNFRKPKNRIMRLFISPFILWSNRASLKGQQIYKANQFWGAWNIIFAKWLWGGKAIGRCGYELLNFTISEKKNGMRIYFVRLISWLIYKYSDMIVLATEADKRFAVSQFSFLANKEIIVEPNWIDTVLFKTNDSVQKIVDIGYIGRFNEQKNLELLVNAAKEAGLSLHLYGGGEQETKLRQMCNDSNCNIFGWVKNANVPNLLNQFNLFVLPSLYEGNPKSLLEAMSCGCAVIASDVPGNREIVTNGENGLLCSLEAESLRRCISKLLNDSDLRKELGKNARRYIIEKHSLKSYLQREEKRLELLLD